MLKLHDIHSLKLLCFVYECTNNSITLAFDSFSTNYKLFMATTLDKHLRGCLYGGEPALLEGLAIFGEILLLWSSLL